jgi:hypothetical protein
MPEIARDPVTAGPDEELWQKRNDMVSKLMMARESVARTEGTSVLARPDHGRQRAMRHCSASSGWESFASPGCQSLA